MAEEEKLLTCSDFQPCSIQLLHDRARERDHVNYYIQYKINKLIKKRHHICNKWTTISNISWINLCGSVFQATKLGHPQHQALNRGLTPDNEAWDMLEKQIRLIPFTKELNFHQKKV